MASDSLNTSSVSTYQPQQPSSGQNTGSSVRPGVAELPHGATTGSPSRSHEALSAQHRASVPAVPVTDLSPARSAFMRADGTISRAASGDTTLLSRSPDLGTGVAGLPTSPSPTMEAVAAGDVGGRETQRQKILDHVNKLLWFCHIQQSKGVTSVRQCSSSFFVLLYQRLFDCTIKDIDWSPNTLEKKQRNVELVLRELALKRYDLTDISAEEVVRLNEDHISRLVLIFAHIAMQREHLERQHQQPPHPSSSLFTPAEAHPSWTATASSGYIVAEVKPFSSVPPAAAQHHDAERGYNTAGLFYPSTMPEETAGFVLSHYGAGTEGPMAAPGDGQTMTSGYEEESPSAESHGGDSPYTEDSIMPIDVMVANWHRGLITPGEADSSMTPTRYAYSSRTSGTQHRQRVSHDGLHTVRPRVTEGGSSHPSSNLSFPRAGPPRVNSAVGLSAATRHSTHDPVRAAPLPPPTPKPDVERRRVPSFGPRVSSALTMEEPLLSRAECRLLASHPGCAVGCGERDRKIERLRASRFLGDMQTLLRQRMRRQYDEDMSSMRHVLHRALAQEQHDKRDHIRQMKEENAKYQAAYQLLMQSAANDSCVSHRLMSRNTAQLAAYYADSLRESRRMCQHLTKEQERQSRAELLRYAQTVSAWQQRLPV